MLDSPADLLDVCSHNAWGLAIITTIKSHPDWVSTGHYKHVQIMTHGELHRDYNVTIHVSSSSTAVLHIIVN